MTKDLSIDEAASEFGAPASHIRAVSQGRKLKGKDPLPVPERFEVRRKRFVGRQAEAFTVVNRRELWGDGRLIWAIQHSDELFDTAQEAEGNI